jgi:hypothetical protein
MSRAARVRETPPLRLELRVPGLQLLPGVRVDPLKALMGQGLDELLAGVLEAPPAVVGNQTCYRIQLQDGVGVSLPLGRLGEAGLNHHRGQVQVTVPALAAVFLHQLPHQVAPTELLSSPGGRLSRFTLRPPAGAAFRLQLGTTSVEVVRL